MLHQVQRNKKMKYSEVNQFDFFGENETDFYNKFSVESILVQGKHREPAPMVTIVLPTYKRPDLLKQALDSALNQVGFEDYQVIVADNEGEDIHRETETSRLLSGYEDEKIVYYRHVQSAKVKMDSAARLARSKWICFLHDDDMLAPNHLYVMSHMVQNHRNVKFLSCRHQDFLEEISQDDVKAMTEVHQISYAVRKIPKSYTCMGYFPGWLGALIDRKAYISTGGMPTIGNGIGDYCMVGKFSYRYGVYQLETSAPLYFRREWRGQLSSGGNWTHLYVEEYKYHVYVTGKYHRFFRDFWNRISAYRILEKCEITGRNSYRSHIDLEEFVQECHMEQSVLEKGRQYTRDMIWQAFYETVMKKLCFRIRYKGQIKV